MSLNELKILSMPSIANAGKVRLINGGYCEGRV